ncbi:MAG: acyl-CoA thioesterase II [Pseudomonadota bacterium]
MSDPVSELLDLLDLELLEFNLFRGQSPDEDHDRQRAFGGQVIAQALAAAYRTVGDRLCHSLHAYFIRPGDTRIPIVYEVDRARDGGSFTTRRVVAIQNGCQILNLSASFHIEEEGWEHQHEMPDVPGPDDLKTREQLRADFIDRIPPQYRDMWTRPRPIDMREVDPLDPFEPEKTSDINHMWFRTARSIEASPAIHHCLLAYASDMALLGTGNRPHGVSWMSGKIMSASLDHSMWFHAPVRADEWLLYSMDAPKAGGARSFNRGKIFTQEGKLVASVAQEGLMRPVRKKK